MSAGIYHHSLSKPGDNKAGRIILIFSVSILLIFHLVANAFLSYGYFRDELYYLACASRPAFGYVDHPPLSVWLLSLWKSVFGNSLFAIRIVPALAIAGVVWFTGRSVLRMGGSALAIVLSSMCIISAPIFLAMGTYYSMNSLDMLFWAMAVYILVGILHNHGSASGKWILLGVVMGLALLNKISFLWFGAGLAVALILPPMRRHLKTPWPYLSAGIAFAVFSPYIIWNISHELPHLEFMQNALRYKYNSIGRMDFISEAILQQNPASIAIWLSGLFFYFVYKPGRRYMPLGLIFLTTFTILLINGHSKAEYLAASSPILFAGGSILLGGISYQKYLKWVPYALCLLLLLSLALAPMVKPLLPPEKYIVYSQKLGIAPGNSEGKETAELHQFFADMHGWKAMAENVSAVYQQLPQAEKKNARVFANNYGEAAALELYAEQYPLPYVIAGHNNYYLWGPGTAPLHTVLVIGGDMDDHLQVFAEVSPVAVHSARYVMPYENNLTIYVCRKPRTDLLTLWPKVKNYN
ncbi:MAG: glycosyltransferase family 39 protein [Cyclobacteriaceae bacterium]